MVNLHSLPDDNDQYQSFCAQRSKHQIDCGISMKQELPQSWMTDLIFWTQLVRLGTSNHVVQCIMHCPMHDAFLESIFPVDVLDNFTRLNFVLLSNSWLLISMRIIK